MAFRHFYKCISFPIKSNRHLDFKVTTSISRNFALCKFDLKAPFETLKPTIKDNDLAKESNFGKIVDLTLEDLREESEDVKNNEKAQLKVKYTKIEGKSSILTGYMVNVKSRYKREKSGTILLEGKRLLQDAIDAGQKPLALFFSRVSDIVDFNLDDTVKLYHVPYKNLKFWSELTTSQGVLGIFATPDTSKYESGLSLPLTVICDNLRDPGNMGSVLRTAAAVGCAQLLLTKGCVDIWEPKVVRSAAGAHFRTRIFQNLTWDDISDLIPIGSAIYLADSHADETESPENVADVYELSITGEKVPVPSEASPRITAYQTRREQSSIPLLPYTTPDYATPTSIAIVIGGETEGLSESAFHLAEYHRGSRVFLPLANGVESLNSGTALGVLAYEIRRQRLG